MDVTVERVYAVQLLMSEEDYEELDNELNFIYSVLSKDRASLMKVQKLLELKDKMTREIKG